jgi:hypothetical protein
MQGFRETKNTQRGVVTLTTRAGKFIVKHGTEERAFRSLEAAQRCYDAIPATPTYNREAVDDAIAASKSEIGDKEARLIHSLLKGRS